MKYKKLTALIPKIEITKSFGSLIVDESEEGEIQFPFYSSTNIVDEFLSIMYDENLIINFDWPSWEEGKRIMSQGNFIGLDSFTLMKLLTAIVRSDRFNEGNLVANFENGNILKILQELENSK
jgi:hypothetical protein